MTSPERIKNVTAVIAGLLSLAVGVFAFFLTSPLMPIAPDIELSAAHVAIRELSEEVARLTELTERNKVSSKATGTEPTVVSKGRDGAQLQRLESDIAKIDKRLRQLEQAILASPAKALEIPLLQRDVDNLKASNQSSIAALKDSVDRVYDLNKWLLGTMALSITSLALTSFFLKGKENNNAKV